MTDDVRVILVQGRHYRCYEERDGGEHVVVVELDVEDPGVKLRMRFDDPELVLLDGRNHISRAVLRQSIRRALSRGWEPEAIGSYWDM